jgi:hypothetical protein
MRRLGETAEEVISALLKVAEGVTIFGVLFPSLMAATKAHNLDYFCVYDCMKRTGRTAEQAIARYLQRQQKEAAE